jgi:hypothetical protein
VLVFGGYNTLEGSAMSLSSFDSTFLSPSLYWLVLQIEERTLALLSVQISRHNSYLLMIDLHKSSELLASTVLALSCCLAFEGARSEVWPA